MQDLPVLIAGGGIGGLTLALTLNQIGVPCHVFEAVSDLKAVGVGINLQPNAVRELMDLGIRTEDLDGIGVQTKEWALVGLNGKDIYSESRGLAAGYQWPQYSLHRGQLQMLLLRVFQERLGAGAISTGQKIVQYEQNTRGVTVEVEDINGTRSSHSGSMLIGADGLHSTVRSQMYPDQPPVRWGGQVMWRGVSQAKPIRTGSSFVGLGTLDHRLVVYPISPPDPITGFATINWIAEIAVDDPEAWGSGDWNKQVQVEDFLHHFADWNFEWLDVVSLIKNAERVYEYPMVDRDPVSSWVDDRVALLGDAAHVMYPTGSNGASQAIVDARVLGASLIAHGVTTAALSAYDGELCEEISNVVLRNRGAGPFGILGVIEERCGGSFDDIHSVVSKTEIDDYMAAYKQAAGFAIQSLNNAGPRIPSGARVS